MKKILIAFLSSTAAIVSLNATAASVEPAGAVTINWTVYQAGVDTTHSATNHTGTTTNILKTTSVKPTSFTIKNANLISLLENSFNTTFAKGSQLVYGDGPVGASIYLVDKTGTNIVFDISPVVSLISSNNFNTGGSSSSTEKITSPTSITISGTGSGTGVGYYALSYDDTALTTANGQNSQFSFAGIATSSRSVKYSETTAPSLGVTGTEKVSFIVTGAGAGVIEGAASVLKGTVNGGASGPYELLE